MDDSKNIPLVSVVIPMFNAFPFIREMLECMVQQTYKNWELLIVDDGSTDESIATVNSYAEKDSRIHLIKRPSDRKKGGNTCRNIGLEQSKGEYIIWFDADDLIAPYCLEQRINFIQSHPEADFAVFPAMAFKERIGDTYMITGAKRTSNDYLNFLKNFVPFQVVTNIYQKESLIKNCIIWDEDLLGRQDPDFNISTIKKGLKYEYSNLKPDYFWRISGNEQSVSKQILCPQKIQTNIYYLKKRYSFDITPSTKRAIQYLTFFIINPLLKSKHSSAVYEILNCDENFSSKISKDKAIRFFKSATSVNSPLIINILLFIYFPSSVAGQFFKTKIWNIRTKYLAYKNKKILMQ